MACLFEVNSPWELYSTENVLKFLAYNISLFSYKSITNIDIQTFTSQELICPQISSIVSNCDRYICNYITDRMRGLHILWVITSYPVSIANDLCTELKKWIGGVCWERWFVETVIIMLEIIYK